MDVFLHATVENNFVETVAKKRSSIVFCHVLI